MASLVGTEHNSAEGGETVRGVIGKVDEGNVIIFEVAHTHLLTLSQAQPHSDCHSLSRTLGGLAVIGLLGNRHG